MSFKYVKANVLELEAAGRLNAVRLLQNAQRFAISEFQHLKDDRHFLYWDRMRGKVFAYVIFGSVKYDIVSQPNFIPEDH